MQGLLIAALLCLLCLVVYRASKKGKTCKTFECPATHTKKSNAANIKKHTRADCCDAIATPTCATFSCPATTHTKKSNAVNIKKHTQADCCDVKTCDTFSCPVTTHTKKSNAVNINKHTQADCCDPIQQNICTNAAEWLKNTGPTCCLPGNPNCQRPCTEDSHCQKDAFEAEYSGCTDTQCGGEGCMAFDWPWNDLKCHAGFCYDSDC